MIEYHKIPAIFERDNDGTKKLIEGKFANKTVEFLADNNWVFTEKIDGTNIRVHWDGHTVTFGGRTENAQIPAKLVAYLNATFKDNATEELFEQKFGENEVTLFGEGYGAGIQKGGSYRNDVSFILFDVMIGGIFLERHNVEDIAKSFGIDAVPVIAVGPLNEGVEIVKSKPNSTIGTAKMEGLVAKPIVDMFDRMGRRVVVKIKVKDFA